MQYQSSLSESNSENRQRLCTKLYSLEHHHLYSSTNEQLGLSTILFDTKTACSHTIGISNFNLNTGLQEANGASNAASKDRKTNGIKSVSQLPRYKYCNNKPQELTAQTQVLLELADVQHGTHSKGITCAYPCWFQPYGKQLLAWLTLLSVSVLYNLWFVIARQAFTEFRKQYNNWWIAADMCTDTIYLMDIVVQLNTPHLEQGLIIQDKRKLARRYVQTKHFALDLLSLLPLDLLQFLVGIQPLLRFPRFIKIYRTVQWKDRIKRQSKIPNVLRLFIRMHVLLLGCHWFACFYYIISTQQNFSTKWGYKQSNNSDVTTGRAYLIAFYWVTLSLMTVKIENAPTTPIERKGSSAVETNTLENLPDRLKVELALDVNVETLKKVAIFKDCRPEFLHDLVLKMRSSVVTPGDYICRKDEIARDFFIVADGVLEMVG
ncbi:hypothetical protein PHET_00246 [Paragonimus heterotremus]|uniref:Cyclic nucleotide-binding domain-containing protein n=1 Tax=Paragonimus heterotremus TaxID=100268 RepID=A0A8J4TJW5_9TREM|nr:hypothetical protein PHET_00246 [Paragonimus heterotremus]